MSRREFLAQLERLLWDIPVQEREEALEFYNNYFDDAGAENESSVIQELGSPGKVAAIIKADLGGSRKEYGEYTETGYSDGIFDDRDMPERAGADTKKENTDKEEQRQQEGNGYNGPTADTATVRQSTRETEAGLCGASLSYVSSLLSRWWEESVLEFSAYLSDCCLVCSESLQESWDAA